VAGRLFGIELRERPDWRAYHPEVRVFEVFEKTGTRIGLFLGDYFARPSKRSGAWMSAFQSQHKLDGGQVPDHLQCDEFSPSRHPASRPSCRSMTRARSSTNSATPCTACCRT
jgi:peptidyl-dipeptidase Dcp